MSISKDHLLWMFFLLAVVNGETDPQIIIDKLLMGESSADAVHGRSDRYYNEDQNNVSRVLDAFTKGYDKRLRPNFRGPPVEVGITMFISSFSSVSEVDMDFTMEFYFRQYWNDPRLTFEGIEEEELCISTEMLQDIWWPDTFFANSKNAKFHTATTKNAFLRIKPNGDVLHSLRLTVTAMCPMDLTYFPMDSQVCSLEIESYGYSMKDIELKWLGSNPVEIHPDVQLPQFRVRGFKLVERLVVLATGNYSRMACEFYFVRSMGYYIIHIYIPSTLIVVLSWVSFWLSRDAVPARVALGITTVLTMTTLISSTNASLPKISYLKSIDVYLVTCFVMVFASLLEYAAVSYISKSHRRYIPPVRRNTEEPSSDGVVYRNGTLTCRRPPQDNQNQDALHTEVRLTSLRKLHTECDLKTYVSTSQPVPPMSSHAPRAPLASMEDIQSTGCSKCVFHCLGFCDGKPSAIDKYSRIFFPLIFVLFNVMYWITYVHITDEPKKAEFKFID